MSLQEARIARDKGMIRAERNASFDWKDLMADLLVQVARERETFTADDVFDRLAAIPNAPTTHDNRAFGPIMMRAVRSGVCVKAGVSGVNSRRKSLHACPRTVWKSLIYGK